MKIPAAYSRRVLMKTHEFWSSGLNEDYIDRIVSPPYVSNVPQVYHHQVRKLHEISRGRASGSRLRPGNGLDLRLGGEDVEEDIALVLCSDGLVDLYEDQDFEEVHMLHRWANVVGEAICHPHGHGHAHRQFLSAYPPHAHSHSRSHTNEARHRNAAGQRPRGESTPPDDNPSSSHSGHDNAAVHLLRDAIGADDISRSSANLTVEMDERWIDDTTIIVHRFS